MEDRPKSLKDEAERMARKQMLNQNHILPLTCFVDEIKRERPDKDVPFFDPLDGGTEAQCLFVLEAPGRMTKKRSGSGFVSRNNNDESAKNFFEVNKVADIPRKKTVTWNIVPWYIGAGEKRRTPSNSEIETGLMYLYRLIDRLPNLRIIVLVGMQAQKVEKEFSAKYPDIEIFKSFHPSPLFVNNKPQNKQKIIDALKPVSAILAGLTKKRHLH